MFGFWMQMIFSQTSIIFDTCNRRIICKKIKLNTMLANYHLLLDKKLIVMQNDKQARFRYIALSLLLLLFPFLFWVGGKW